MPALKALAALGVASCLPSGASGQDTDVITGVTQHVCGDCHGLHGAQRGRSGLVRAATSELVPFAPGLGLVSIRCLQCHGTEGDRRQAVSDRPVPEEEALLLGGSLQDDHLVGWAGPDGDPSGPVVFDPMLPLGGRSPVLRVDFDVESAVQCESCHAPHDPWIITQATQQQDDTCLVCHSETLDVGGHGIAACGACHSMHGAPASDHLIRERSPDYLCGACHEGAPEPLNPGIEPLSGQPLHMEPADTRCSDCHRIHDPHFGM